jgi:hypothetical protein
VVRRALESAPEPAPVVPRRSWARHRRLKRRLALLGGAAGLAMLAGAGFVATLPSSAFRLAATAQLDRPEDPARGVDMATAGTLQPDPRRDQVTAPVAPAAPGLAEAPATTRREAPDPVAPAPAMPETGGVPDDRAAGVAALSLAEAGPIVPTPPVPAAAPPPLVAPPANLAWPDAALATNPATGPAMAAAPAAVAAPPPPALESPAPPALESPAPPAFESYAPPAPDNSAPPALELSAPPVLKMPPPVALSVPTPPVQEVPPPVALAMPAPPTPETPAPSAAAEPRSPAVELPAVPDTPRSAAIDLARVPARLVPFPSRPPSREPDPSAIRPTAAAGGLAGRCRSIIQRLQIGETVDAGDIRLLQRGCQG